MVTVTLEEAYDYFNNERLFSDDWLMADSQKQEQSIKMATNQVNRIKYNRIIDNYKEIAVKKAICEQALYLVQTLDTQRSKLIEQGVTGFSVEGLSENYDTSKSSNKLCTEAMEYLKKYTIGYVSLC